MTGLPSFPLDLEVEHQIPVVLPHAQMFSIQVGYKLFRLSGLSLSSDAPSYFTKFFSQEGNADKVLFIDRNPKMFEVIYSHLQGYSVTINTDFDFTAVLSDCFYYGLKGLQNILLGDSIFATIGNKSFKVAKDLFESTGNSPNYFTVLYDNYFVDNKVIEERNMLRPPPQRPACLNNRSPKLFEDLLEILRGNPTVIQSDEHRQLLIRECKYYRFLALEQLIIKHKIVNNPFSPVKQEIVINLMNLHKNGVFNESPSENVPYPLLYARPFLRNERRRGLVLELETDCDINAEYSEVRLIVNKTFKIVTVNITHKLCRKILQVFKDFSKDFILEGMDSDRPSVTFLVGFQDAHSVINGLEMNETWINSIFDDCGDDNPAKKRKTAVKGDIIEFKLTRSLWNIVAMGDKVRLQAVSMIGVTDNKSFIREKYVKEHKLQVRKE